MAESDVGDHYVGPANWLTDSFQIPVNPARDLSRRDIKRQHLSTSISAEKTDKGCRLFSLVEALHDYHDSNARHGQFAELLFVGRCPSDNNCILGFKDSRLDIGVQE